MKNKMMVFNINKLKVKEYFHLFILIFCAIVGVGFVSGAEIYNYFAKYGNFGYFGAIIFFVAVYIVLNVILINIMNFRQNSFINKTKIKEGEKFKNKTIENNQFDKINFNNEDLLKIKNVNFQKIKLKIYNVVVFFNVLIFSGAMISGLKNFTKNLFYHNYFIVFLGLIFSVFILLFVGVKWLKKVDYFVILFVIFLLFCIIFDLKIKGFEESFLKNKNDFILNFSNQIVRLRGDCIRKLLSSVMLPVFYVFTNMFQIQPLIESSEIRLKTKKECRLFALLFAGILSFIVVIFIVFFNLNKEIIGCSMPFLEYFKTKNGAIRNVYVLGLLFALISTFVSCLIGVKQNVMKRFKFGNFKATIFSFFLAVLVGFLPYKIFIEIVYPSMGLINLIVFVLCL